VAIDGLDQVSLQEHWRSLCKGNGQASPAFKEIYRHVTTLRGCSFRFRGGDREQIRKTLEDLFRETFPRAKARITREENAPALV
jgi:hypothetical protein